MKGVKMKKFLIPLALVMVVILLFTGCGGGTTTTPSTTTTTAGPSIKPPVSTETIKKGGTLRILYGLSPQSTPGWPGDTANFQKLWLCFTVFEALVKQDAAGQPVPYLATNGYGAPTTPI